MKHLGAKTRHMLFIAVFLAQYISPLVTEQTEVQTSSILAESSIPTLSEALIPTIDSYELSTETTILSDPDMTIPLEEWQNGFSIHSNSVENITSISFKFIYSDKTTSPLYKIEQNLEDVCEDADQSVLAYNSQLYTSVKTLSGVEFYYNNNQQFNVDTFPTNSLNKTQSSILSVGDADKIAYEKEFMEKLGLSIITRDEWGAPTTMTETFSTSAVNRIVIHHTATSVNMADPKVTVKAIFDYHNCSKADYEAGRCASGICCDIGYNYLIDPYGNLYQGRSGFIRTRGAHAVPNTGSIGISIMGNFENDTPTQAALTTLAKLVAGLSQVYGIDLTMTRDFQTGYQQGLQGHKDVIGCPDSICAPAATACPGRNLYSLLDSIRSAANQLKLVESPASLAYIQMEKLADRNNLVINDGYVEILLSKAGLDPAINPSNYSTEDNLLFGIKIIDDTDDHLIIGVLQAQYRQFISEILLTNPESNIQPNYQYEITALGTDDTYGALLWALENTGQTINSITGTDNADIKAPEAWGVTEGTTDNIIVAIIDTGVAYNHPDLMNNMWDGSTCYDENNDLIVGGCLHGYDYMSYDNNPLPGPTDPWSYRNHGTIIAGIIGAERNNTMGIAGIAPKVKMMAVKSSFNTSSILKEVNFAKNNGATIINASWGADGAATCMDAYDASLYNAFANFPGLIFVAAGNLNRNHNLTTYFEAPADYGHTTECWDALDNVISVGASDQYDEKADFSDYGIAIDIVAPGDNILSTTDNTVFEGYGYMSGTSMATPYAVGLAAYIWSTDPHKTNSEVKDQIFNGGETLESLCYLFGTQKRINAYYSINGIITENTTCATDSTPPIVSAGVDIHSYVHVDRVLSGNASDDLSGIGAIMWTVESGPGYVTFDNYFSLTPTIYGHVVGTHVLRLNIKDMVSNTSFDDLNLIIHETADYNNDGEVDEIDFAYLAIYWNGVNQMADFNGDGSIDEIDFALLAINWTGL